MFYFKTGIIYMIGEVLNKGAVFILIPIITNNLSISEFGELSIVDIIFSLFSIFVILSIQNGFIRFYQSNKDQYELKELYSTAFIFSISVITIEFMVFFVLYKYKFLVELNITDWNIVIWYVFFRAAFSQLNTFMLSYYTLNYKAKEKVLFNLAKVIVSVAIISHLLINEHEGLLGVVKGYLVGEVVLFTLLVTQNKQKISFMFNYIKLKRMLSFSLWAIPSGISFLLLTMSDKYFLSQYLDMKSVGLYALAFKIGMILSPLYITPFFQVFGPYKYKNWDKKNANALFNGWLFTYSFIGCSIILLLTMNSELIILALSTREYLESKEIIPLILFSTLLYGMTPFYTVGIQKIDKNHYTALVIGAGAVINVFLNVVLIQRYGFVGAAVATILAFLIINALLNFISFKLYKEIKYKFVRNISLYILSVFVLVIYEMIKLDNSYLFNVSLSIGLVLIFLFVVYFSSKDNQKDIHICLIRGT